MRNSIVCFVLFAFFVCHAEEFKKVSVETVPAMSGTPPKGSYYSQTYRVKNKTAEPVEVDLFLDRKSYQSNVTAERSVLLPPGGVQNVELYLPAQGKGGFYGYSRNSVRLSVDGSFLENSLSGGSTGYHYIDLKALFSSSTLKNEYAKLFLIETDSSGRRVEASNIPVQQWSGKLHDYIGFRRIYLLSTDKVPPEIEKPMMEWVRLGGTLVICVEASAQWPEKVAGGEKGLHVEQIGWGRRIFCRPIPANAAAVRKSLDTKGTLIDPDKGKADQDEVKTLKLGANADFLASLASESQPLLEAEPDNYLKTLLPKVKEIPLHTLFAVMAVFVVLIGPVNYLWLKKRHKEPWLLVTTPILSLLFCLLVILFISLNEGWYSRGNALGITLLDQTRQLAVTKSWAVLYAPVSPRNGFNFEESDCLTFSNNGSFTAMETGVQHYNTSLVRPRIPLSFCLSRVERRREQLKISDSASGALTVVNGLGARLTELVVIAPDGRLFPASAPVESGSKIELKASGERMGTKSFHSISIQQKTLDAAQNKFKDFAPVLKILPPGYYMALAETPLFFTAGMRPKEFSAHQLVIGKYNLNGDDNNAN